MFTRPSIIRLPDDLPLLTGDQRGALPVTQTGLFPTADCHLCSPDLTRVILFHGLSLSHLRPFNQQPRGLCLLFILTILFPCAQDCDRCAQSVSVSLSRSWVLLDPVCDILNASFTEQRLPRSWKDVNVTPLIKVKPVTTIAKHIRPISLTPALSKLAEDFVVSKYIGSAVLETIDSNQFGAIPNSSTLHALISMMHTWAQATDGTSSPVRVVCLDYRKAFDLVDHGILAAKILGLRIPRGIARWVCDFLMDRRQRV